MTTVEYKVCKLLDNKVWQNGLQSAFGITKCGRVDCEVRQGLQSVAGLQSEIEHILYVLLSVMLLERVSFLY